MGMEKIGNKKGNGNDIMAMGMPYTSICVKDLSVNIFRLTDLNACSFLNKYLLLALFDDRYENGNGREWKCSYGNGNGGKWECNYGKNGNGVQCSHRNGWEWE